jgi:hypothetical protein
VVMEVDKLFSCVECIIICIYIFFQLSNQPTNQPTHIYIYNLLLLIFFFFNHLFPNQKLNKHLHPPNPTHKKKISPVSSTKNYKPKSFNDFFSLTQVSNNGAGSKCHDGNSGCCFLYLSKAFRTFSKPTIFSA